MNATGDSEDEVLRLLRMHVPGLASGAVRIRGFARERGRLSMICVEASDRDGDPIGICAPGARVVVRSLASAERVEVVRWSDSPEALIRNVLGGTAPERVVLDATTRRANLTMAAETATVLASDGGVRLRVASQVTGWDLQVITP